MQYSLEKISTVVKCDALLASARKKKQTLERRTRNLGESIERFRTRLDNLGQEMALVQAMLLIFIKGYNALPEGSKYKLNMNIKVKRLELRQARLEVKAFTCNERALLVKEVKYNLLRAQLATMNAYIAAVQKKRMALLHPELLVGQSADSSFDLAVHQKSQAERRLYKIQERSYPTYLLQRRSLGNSLAEERRGEVLLSSYPPRIAAG